MRERKSKKCERSRWRETRESDKQRERETAREGNFVNENENKRRAGKEIDLRGYRKRE